MADEPTTGDNIRYHIPRDSSGLPPACYHYRYDNPIATSGGLTLQPCPFCGKPGERWVDEGGDHPRTALGCRDCGIEMWPVEDWNRRPIEDALRAEIKRLHGVIDDLNEYM